jgi:hypothetical protein
MVLKQGLIHASIIRLPETIGHFKREDANTDIYWNIRVTMRFFSGSENTIENS